LALTITPIQDGVDIIGRRRVLLADVNLDSSYPSGGYDVTTVGLGLKAVVGMDLIGGNTASGAYDPIFNTQTNKLQVFYTPAAGGGAFVEVPNGTNLSAVTFRFVFYSVSD
jgi:hypothetical protein